MDEESVTMAMQMISAAGLARTRYLEAVRAAKQSDFEKVRMLMEEGDECFGKAHEIHGELLASGCGDLLDCKNAGLNLILVHAEDQMMCAETFRVLGSELIEIYKVCPLGVHGNKA